MRHATRMRTSGTNQPMTVPGGRSANEGPVHVPVVARDPDPDEDWKTRRRTRRRAGRTSRIMVRSSDRASSSWTSPGCMLQIWSVLRVAIPHSSEVHDATTFRASISWAMSAQARTPSLGRIGVRRPLLLGHRVQRPDVLGPVSPVPEAELAGDVRVRAPARVGAVREVRGDVRWQLAEVRRNGVAEGHGLLRLARNPELRRRLRQRPGISHADSVPATGDTRNPPNGYLPIALWLCRPRPRSSLPA